MIYGILFLLLYFLRLLLQMNWITTGVTAACVLMLLPRFRKQMDQVSRQKRRFTEASIYMDSVLYAFEREHKMEAALRDVELTLQNGPLKNCVSRAVSYMQMTYDETEVAEAALGMIEEEYPCKRIRDIHRFMIHVELLGGEVESSIRILTEDKARWEKRMQTVMQERQKMWVEVVLSVLVSLLICGVVLALPVLSVDISAHPVTQILTVVVLFLDGIILLRAQSFLAPDYLNLDQDELVHEEEKKMQQYRFYDEEKERKRSGKLGILAALFTIVLIWRFGEWAGLIGASVSLVCFYQHRIGFYLMKRNLKKSIACAFPGWLMDLVLLLQSENVQMALEKSQEFVPPVLRTELVLLVDRLHMSPEDSEPFHMFLQDFDLPQVHSAMSMLYSLSIGNSRNSDRQVTELISVNQNMLDQAQMIRLRDKSSGMYLLFLAPMLTGSAKLLTDMAIFIVTFMTTAVWK